MSTPTRYTIRSEGGGLSAPGADAKEEAMRTAVELAIAHPGQRIALHRNGRPVKGHVWCQGPRAEVQQ